MRQHFPIGELHKKWILENFKKKEIVFDEESMISILENENSTFSLKLDAAIALREIGTKNCIGALLNSIHL